MPNHLAAGTSIQLVEHLSAESMESRNPQVNRGRFEKNLWNVLAQLRYVFRAASECVQSSSGGLRANSFAQGTNRNVLNKTRVNDSNCIKPI